MKKLIYSLFLLFLFVSLKEVYAIDPPQLQIPSNGQQPVPIPVFFNWGDVAGATSYSLSVYYGFELTFYQGGITASEFTSPSGSLQGGTTYLYKVASHAGTDSAESVIWTFTTGSALPSAPVLLFPPDDTTNMPLSFVFDWETIDGAIYYTLQVTTDPTFNTVTYTFPSINASQFYITSGYLNLQTVYFWRVSATNTTGTGPWCTAWQFSTKPNPPPAPTLTQPPNGATGVELTPLLKWTVVPVGTVNYDVEVSPNSSFNTLIFSASDLDSAQKRVPPGTLSGLSQYWWRARAKNVGGAGPWSTVFNFTTQAAPPAVPVLVVPLDSAENVARSPYFAWNASLGATSYRIQVSTDPNFGTQVINTTTGGTNYQTALVLNYYTRYYWRVNATNAVGTSAYSPVRTFRTIPGLLAPPVLTAPVCGATGITLTPQMSWEPVTGAVRYNIQIATNPSYSASSILLSQEVENTSFTIPSGNLSGGFTYYWRVCSINAAGNFGDYSHPPGSCSFTTKQTLNSYLKVYLEGFYNGTTQVRDTVNVYIANPTSPWAIKDSTKAYLSVNGTDTLSFQNATAGNYYIVIKHRNHIETWSATPQTFALGAYVNYDFTTGSGMAYGNNMKNVGGKWVLYGGDADQDGQVFTSDYNLFITQFGKDAYRSCDLNGDTFVDGYDLPILYGNITKRRITPPNPGF